MRNVLVRYQTKPDQGDENQRLVEQVFEELHEQRPDRLRYAAFRLADGVTFVHVAFLETEDGSNPLTQTTAFPAFQRDIAARCSEPPAAQDASVVGSYRFFAD
jgi:hypothetical protein